MLNQGPPAPAIQEVQSRFPVDPQDPGFVSDDWFLPKHLPFKRKNHCRDAKQYWKRLKQVLSEEKYGELTTTEPTYVSIEAGQSTYPAKKYCDITGFEASYTDPKTKLRFANKDIYPIVQGMQNDEIQARLAVRKAQIILR